jgi:CheY-like chemotaxis protein
MRSATILIAEDEPTARMSLAGLFEAEGFRVLPAEKGNEALSLLLAEEAEAGVLDTDRSLGRQIAELFELIRQYGPEDVAAAIKDATQAGPLAPTALGDYFLRCRRHVDLFFALTAA